MNSEIETYNAAQSDAEAAVCDRLARLIDTNLPATERKIWHRHPVWFIDGNPIVGYSKLKDGIRLLFWSGQSFQTDGLVPQGKFKAAEVRYTHPNQVEADLLKRWLAEAVEVQWDYKNIVKRRGRLERMKEGSASPGAGS